MNIACKILLFTLFCCKSASAQTFNTKYLEGTRWATQAKDSLFFNSDTIKIVKVLDRKAAAGKSMDLASYFENTDYLMLEFGKGGRLKLWLYQIDAWSVSSLTGNYTWSYDAGQKKLAIFFNKKPLSSFEPLYQSSKSITVKSNFVKDKGLQTIEVSLKRL